MTTDATTTTTTPANPAPTGAEPAGSIEAFAAELLGTSPPTPTGEQAAGASPTPGEQPQASPTPGERGQPVARVELPDLGKVREVAQQRARERAEREAQLQPLQALEAKISERLDALPTGPALPLAKLRDPKQAIAALREAGVDVAALVQAGARAQLAPDPTERFEALLEAKLAPVLERLGEKKPEPAAAPDREAYRSQAADTFVQYCTGAASQYPQFARMARVSPKAAAALALEYVDGLAAMGQDTSRIPDSEVAAAIERSFADPQPADPPQAAEGGTSSGTPIVAEGSAPQRPIPGSLHNGHAAEASRSPPKGKKAEIEDLVSFAKTLGIG